MRPRIVSFLTHFDTEMKNNYNTSEVTKAFVDMMKNYGGIELNTLYSNVHQVHHVVDVLDSALHQQQHLYIL